VLTWLAAQTAMRRYREKLVELDQSRGSTSNSEQSYMQIPSVMALGEDEAFEGMVALWSRSSIMMKQLLDQRKIPYFQFLQPNQYVKTQRVFGKEESAVAFSASSPFIPGAAKGYPLLLNEITKLKQAGVNVFNAVEVFDTIGEPVYLDNCCHYNKVGNLAFGQYVAGRVVQTLKDSVFLNQQSTSVR
jgi:hypothetical protein